MLWLIEISPPPHTPSTTTSIECFRHFSYISPPSNDSHDHHQRMLHIIIESFSSAELCTLSEVEEIPTLISSRRLLCTEVDPLWLPDQFTKRMKWFSPLWFIFHIFFVPYSMFSQMDKNRSLIRSNRLRAENKDWSENWFQFMISLSGDFL